MARMSRLLSLAALALGLSACAGVIPKPPEAAIPPPPGAQPTTALAGGIARGPAIDTLALTAPDAGDALNAFRSSCRWLTTKDDRSGLTRSADWQPACDAAANWSDRDAARFFATQFETVQVGDGTAFATGYFEPELLGSRTRIPGYDTPVYAVPDDMVRAWPADTPQNERTGQPPLGRYDETGAFVPYYDRAAIDAGALAGRGLEIAWVADPIEFFFLQIQGSGLLRLPDGSRMRIGYAAQNGRGYTAIGALMRERGLFGDGPGQYASSMQGIVAYLRDHPVEGQALMHENPSYIFFRELTTDGPLGSLGVPVRGGSSAAVDPRYVPYGAPVVLQTDRAEANGLWIAQDTGGAIKGANRFDTFWGNGDRAREIAGGMSARGRAFVLVPKGTYARLTGR